MSFRFADVEFGVQDEHGHEVTSAVLIQTHYNAAEASTAPPSRRGQGKNQGKCLDLLEGMLADRRAKIEKSGRDPGLAHISLVEWREAAKATGLNRRSEEHTSELQSLMRNSYAVFCLKKKTHDTITRTQTDTTINHAHNRNKYTRK